MNNLRHFLQVQTIWQEQNFGQKLYIVHAHDMERANCIEKAPDIEKLHRIGKVNGVSERAPRRYI